MSPSGCPDGADSSLLGDQTSPENVQESSGLAPPSEVATPLESQPDPTPKTGPCFKCKAAQVEGNSVLWLTASKMEKCDISEGDHVRVRSLRGRDTCLVARSLRKLGEEKVGVDDHVLSTLQVKAGDTLIINRVVKLPDASEVTVKPFADGWIEGNDVWSDVLAPTLQNGIRFLRKDERFKVNTGNRFEFVVLNVVPEEAFCGPSTFVKCKGFAIKPYEERFAAIKGKDIIGNASGFKELKDLLTTTFQKDRQRCEMGVEAHKGLVVTGLPNTGKTLLIHACANEFGLHKVNLRCQELMVQNPDAAVQRLEAAFDDATTHWPAIIILRDVDLIASSHASPVLKAALVLHVENMPSGKVLVAATATNLAGLDAVLLQNRRFSYHIDLAIPGADVRRQLLEFHGKHLEWASLTDDVKDMMVSKTAGFVAGDIRKLSQTVGHIALNDAAPAEQIGQHAWNLALKRSAPQSIQDSVVSMPELTWDDIGGYHETKQALQEMITIPLRHPSLYKAYNIRPPRGALLFGPPGCGKTMFAKVAANECEANFLSVKGPELLNSYFGESEANIRNLFAKARKAPPCLLFFDEIDSIGVKRSDGAGGAGGAGGVEARIINQLLTEIDGCGADNDMYLLGATNRPDLLDEALVRPGRFDRTLFIPPPDVVARAHIFSAILRKKSNDATAEAGIPAGVEAQIPAWARKSEGMSGADIANLCGLAVQVAISEHIESLVGGTMRAEDAPQLQVCHFETAWKSARSHKDRDLSHFQKFLLNNSAHQPGSEEKPVEETQPSLEREASSKLRNFHRSSSFIEHQRNPGKISPVAPHRPLRAPC